jgi:hypothetical protein
MNTKLITTIAAIALLPLAGFTQAPPNPLNPPPPPGVPPDRHEDRHEKKVPVTFLGVETSEAPSVVSEQLGLAKGFGLVVDYVVPDSPAAAAGVRQNDIIKMLNDQILTEPDQLAKLVRSYSEGTNITLTVLRKGKEEKVTVKLVKKEMSERPEFPERFRGHRGHSDFPFGNHDFDDFGMGDLRGEMRDLKGRLGNEQRGMIHDAVMKAREEAMRAREQVKRAGDQIRILSKDQDAIKSTKIDVGKAQIVYSDDKGELRLEKIDGKEVLTAKDPQGLLLFSGPIETKEDLDKIPVEVRQRYEKLRQNELPAVIPTPDTGEDDNSADTDQDDDEQNETPSAEQVLTASILSSAGISRAVLF